MSLAGALKGIVSQRLVQRCDRDGRVPAMEVLVSTGRVFDKIADSTQTHELEEIIADGEYYGMQTFDQSLLHLYADGVVSRRDALSTASNPHDLRLKMEHYELTAGARPRPHSRRRRSGASRPTRRLIRLLRLGRTPVGRHVGPGAGHNEQRHVGPAAPRAPARARRAGPAGRARARRRRSRVLPRRRERPGRADRRRPRRVRLRHRRPARAHRGAARADGRPRLAPGQAVRHRRRAGGRRARARSPPTGPRCTGPTRASPRCPSATRSSRTCPGATSRSTPWRSRLPDAVLVDPYDGAADLASGRLRTPLTPEVSFTDDPLRMLRAARFVARFGFVPDPDLVAAVEALGDRLDIVSVERIRDELSKLLAGAGPVGRAVVPRVHRPRRPLPARAQPDGARAGPDPPPQGRARAHDRGRGQDEPRPRAAPRGADARRREAEDPVVRARAGHVPPPRGGGRADDAASASPRCGTRPRSWSRSPSSSTSTCASTPTRWAGPTPRCVGTSATPAICSSSSTSCSGATAPRATSGRRARSRAGWTSSRRASPRSPPRRSCGRSSRRSTASR